MEANIETSTRLLIAHSDVAAFGQGARVLGCGGGGDTTVPCQALRRLLQVDGRTLEVLPADSLSPTAQVVPFGLLGGTGMLSERPPSGPELLDACRAFGEPDAIIPLEIGGLNGVAAALAAHLLGVPLVDADLMGRAFPRLDQVLPIAQGWDPCPAAIVDSNLRKIVLHRMESAMLQEITRLAMTRLGGWAAFSCHPFSAREIPALCHQGTVSHALRLGEYVWRLINERRNPTAESLGGVELGSGRAVEVSKRSDRVTVVVDTGSNILRIEAQNEWIAVVEDGEPIVTVPDLIMLWDLGVREPLGVESAHVGQSVWVAAIPGAPGWWHPANLPLVAPSSFGLDVPATRTSS